MCAMSYSYELFDYICPNGHRNQFEFLHAPSTQLAPPQMLPCSGCNYQLIPVTVSQPLLCNFKDNDAKDFTKRKYVESCAYHEAGHVVIGSVGRIPLRKQGICIDQKGAGYSHYKTMRLTGVKNVGRDPRRDKAIRSTQAGYLSQEKYYLRFFKQLPPSGSSNDTNYVNGLLDEMYDSRQQFFEEKDRLAAETQQLVNQHWQAIEAIAQTLIRKTPETQAPRSGERRWSTQLFERRLDRYEVVAQLNHFNIPASVEVAGVLASLVRKAGFALGYLSEVGRESESK
jgi:hypothetical protein